MRHTLGLYCFYFASELRFSQDFIIKHQAIRPYHILHSLACLLLRFAARNVTFP